MIVDVDDGGKMVILEGINSRLISTNGESTSTTGGPFEEAVSGSNQWCKSGTRQEP